MNFPYNSPFFRLGINNISERGFARQNVYDDNLPQRFIVLLPRVRILHNIIYISYRKHDCITRYVVILCCVDICKYIFHTHTR